MPTCRCVTDTAAATGRGALAPSAPSVGGIP